MAHSQRRGSLVDSLVRLEVGETFSESRVIPKCKVSAEEIRIVKRVLGTTLSSAVSRVKQDYALRRYRVETVHTVTDELTALVAVIVTREEDEL